MSSKKKFKYQEAFTLMIYRCATCEHTEIFYNNRDGAAPLQTPCPTCNPFDRPGGTMMEHVAWDADWQVPGFVPPPDMGVWSGPAEDPHLKRM